MKTQLFVVGACLLMTAQGCRYMTETPKAYHEVVVIDDTDTLTIREELTIEHIKGTLPISKNQKQGISFTMRKISDSRYTESYTAELASHSEMDVNEYDRPVEIEDFLKDVENMIEKMKRNRKPLKQSFVLHSVFDALNDLAEIKDAGKRRLLVVSDLAENSPFFSVYRKKDFALLKNDPEKFREKVDQEFPLEHSLKEIEVIFIHQSNTKDDTQFHEMALFLESYLEEHGADVDIVSSFNAIKP